MKNRGLIDTAEYRAYINAKGRCSCGPDNKNYADYAGRGIKFLFTSFKEFIQDVGLKPSSELMLDRIDNDGNYEPGNIRWATASVSKTNQRMTRRKLAHNRRIAALGASKSPTVGKTAHIRWHVNRGMVKEDCRLCNIQRQA